MIAITRGQLRRRLIHDTICLLSVVPWWVVFMSLLFSGGQLVFNGGYLGMGPCDDCCPGTITVGTPCGDCSGDTAKMWSVTFDSVDHTESCQSCSNGYYFSTGSGSFSTYTITQTGDDPCFWTGTGTGPYINKSVNSDCSTVDATYSTVDITMFHDSGQYTLYALLPGTGLTGNVYWFLGSGGDSDCMAAQTLSNSNVSHDCSTVGTGGTVTVTPI